MMFFALPTVRLCSGKPVDSEGPSYRFITRKSDPSENNILEGELDDNISKRYSKITVVGQQQGTNSMGLKYSQSGSAHQRGFGGQVQHQVRSYRR